MENRKRKAQIATDEDAAVEEIGGKRVKAELEQHQDDNVIQFITETRSHSPDAGGSSNSSSALTDEMEVMLLHCIWYLEESQN